MGTVTVLLEKGLVTPKQEDLLRLETPSGLVKAFYQKVGDKIKNVKLINIPSFLHSKDLQVTSSKLGELQVDIAYGGNFYAIIEPQKNFQGLEHHSANELIEMGREIRKRLNEQYTFIHPLD